MTKLLTSIVFFLVINFTCDAQTWQWLSAANGTTSSNGTSGCTDQNGNVFITGFYLGSTTFGTNTLQAATAPGNNIYLVKYDPSGNVLWAKNSICGTGSTDDIWSVCADPVGNSIITGRIGSSQIGFGTHTLTNNSLQEFIVKYDSNGNVLWAKTSEGDAIGEGVSTDAAGNIYQTGSFNTTVAFDSFTLNANGSNIFIVKYDPNGTVLWAKNSVCNDFFNNGVSSISTDANGNSVITGVHSSSVLAFDTHSITTNHIQNIFTAKYDGNGNALWAKTVNGNAPDVSRSVSTDNSGNTYITGNYSSSPFIFGTSTLTTTGNDIFTAKYDLSGNELWAVSATGTNIVGYSISSYAGGLFIAGSMDSNGTPIVFGTSTLSPPLGFADPCFIAQLDPNGNVVFANSLKSGGDDWINVSTDQYCNAYLSGDFSTNTFSLGTYTVSQSGQENAFVAKLTYTCSLTVLNQNTSSNSISLYPNPNNGFFKLQVDKEINNGELIIMNTLGQIVFHQKVNKGSSDIEINNLSKGIYYYTLEENKTKLSSGKLVIE